MEEPDKRKNEEGKDVLIFQTGKNGLYVNRFDVEFEKKKKQ